jgi:hypothetical protein
MELEETPTIILGTSFLCRGLPLQEKADLDFLLAGFPRLPQPARETVELRFAETPEGAFLDGGGSRWDLTHVADPLSSHAEYRLIDEALRRARGLWVLHAGAVETPGGTCLVIGESGAGKTSLTLWLWTSGLRLGTDDLCPIRHGSLIPEVFPRALHMDAEYSPHLMARMPPRPAGYPRDYYPFPDTSDTPLPGITRLIVLERGLKRSPRPEGEVEPLSQSEAVHHLLGAAIRTPGFDFGQAWEDLRRLADGCRAWRLSASTPEGAGERALELMSC